MGAVTEKLKELLKDEKFRKIVVTLGLTVLQILLLRRPPTKPG